MPRDTRTDAYIERAAPFARPILRHLRELVHDACGELDETIKWGRPFFMLDGRPLAMMSAFTRHVGFGFWRGGALDETARDAEASGQFGRLTTLADVPDAAIVHDQVRRAAAVIRAGAPAARPRGMPKPPVEVPPDLAAALAANPAAEAAFAGLRPSHRREYVEWVADAKRPETRERRLAKTIERLEAGKDLNAAYR